MYFSGIISWFLFYFYFFLHQGVIEKTDENCRRMLLHRTVTDGQLFDWLDEQRAPVDFNNTDPLMNHKWYRNPFASLRFSKISGKESVPIQQNNILHYGVLFGFVVCFLCVRFFVCFVFKNTTAFGVWHGCTLSQMFRFFLP